MKKILIMEDDEHIQFLIRAELMDDGYEVMIAPDGKEAMSLIRNWETIKPDLVILEVRMPGMDGFQLLGNLLEIKGKSHVIIHSGYAGYKAHPLCLAADAFILKSHDFSELNATVHELLGENTVHAPSGGR